MRGETQYFHTRRFCSKNNGVTKGEFRFIIGNIKYKLVYNLCDIDLNTVRHWGSGLKWTVMGESGRSKGVKVDGLNNSKWTVSGQSGRSKKAQSGRSAKVDGPEIRKWTVQRAKNGRSFGYKLDGPKGPNWTVIWHESGRS